MTGRDKTPENLRVAERESQQGRERVHDIIAHVTTRSTLRQDRKLVPKLSPV